ncbi:DUF3742 family protein [Burkholderia ubonensis]|uniref:DUF3742 family protein n=1 Tax=Burkholderia ubonensis TaxID=101571 RepID=UPI00075338F6|nr:DUF3742 family protein [Burkholderia ubonensis]KVW44757.1 hypothetical protein WK95_10205 [Burkholderia ubonensis]
MNTSTHITVAERLGRALGCVWRAYKRWEARAVQWMVGKGMSGGNAIAVLWAVKLLVLGVLLYVAFWLALLVVFAIVAAWLAQYADDTPDEERPQWRNGLSGYGLYRGDTRIDPGSQDDE